MPVPTSPPMSDPPASDVPAAGKARKPASAAGRKAGTPGGRRVPSELQLIWLRRGLSQPGGKLPLFDDSGQRVSSSVIAACRRAGWIEPWFHNPIKPSWEVCRLTDAGRAMLAEISVVPVDFRKGRGAPAGP